MAAIDELRAAHGLRLVGASAGTGKTYCLTHHVTEALASGQADPEGLVAVTFTIKAQAELEARLRHRLLQRGAHETAAALPLAYLGTVHGVCLRLLKEFALDAGLPPGLDVIPAHEGRRLLQAMLERELPPELLTRLERLASSLEVRHDPRSGRVDVVTPIDDIMSLCRGNRIAPELLPTMARRSWEELSLLLPPASHSGATLEAELAAALERAVLALSSLYDGQQNTRDACALLQACAQDLERGQLRWSQWAKLAKVKPGKGGVPLVADVRAAAAAHQAHPRFRAELRELIDVVFEASRVALTTYAEWKARRALVDFVDMVDGALSLANQPDIARDLADRLVLVVVDEFQDTSPIQLALFMRLHALVGASVWVGDRKQCIFEYAGADPDLMDAVTRWVRESGGDTERLSRSYRSRPELVELCSRLFAPAFARHGIEPEDVATVADRPAEPLLSGVPPASIWWLEGQEQAALAAGVAALLVEPSSTPVTDPRTGAVRPLEPGDIAVLVYSNADAERLSVALAALGIDSALARAGLLSTPEGSLLRAALFWLVDRRDELAAAELAALTGYDGRTHEEWLRQRIDEVARAHPPMAPAHSGDEAPRYDPPCAACARLDTLRPELTTLAPAEVVDRVLSVLDVAAWAQRWPDPAQRTANLEALRALAAAYEERCSYQREAASLAGLARYLDETREKLRQRDEERASDEQHVRGGAAVVISTYHKAKGLEWPLVVLSGLDRAPKRDAFEVALETDGRPFNPEQPLAGRWIRYWPWPLGAQRQTPLRERAESSDTGRRVAERERRERVRLQYVGWTRARDHLVLGVRRQRKGPCIDWLDELADERGPLLTLPDPNDAAPVLRVRSAGEAHRVPVRCRSFCPTPATPAHEPDSSVLWFAPAQGLPGPVHYRVTPSRASTELVELGHARVLRSGRLDRRMPFNLPRGTSWDTVGTTLHAFLAADLDTLSDLERRSLADRVLVGAGLANAFAGDTLIAASDALRRFVAWRWPDAAWCREVPIRAHLATERGARLIDGCIDLLLETPRGVVIIDHKSFPGRAAEWEARAVDYAPQLLAYARALEIAGKRVLAMIVHFTVGGGIVELEVGDAEATGSRVASVGVEGK
jgi:ATP-dependent helicase/nuclease subunit A